MKMLSSRRLAKMIKNTNVYVRPLDGDGTLRNTTCLCTYSAVSIVLDCLVIVLDKHVIYLM